MKMSLIFSVLFIFCCSFNYGSSQRVVLQTIIDDSNTLVLREGDDPCKILHEMCCDNHGESDKYIACIETAYPLMTRQLTAAWRHLSHRLTVHPGIFLDCKEVYDQSNFNLSLIRRNAQVQDLLDILRRGEGEKAAREFDVRRNGVRMTEEEQLELYLQAILLEPNHPLILGQLGVTLLATGRENLARALFIDAVRRGIWENVLQRPVNYYVPGLTSKPWYNAHDFSFTEIIEKGYEDIRKELLPVTEGNGNDLFYIEAENRNSFNIEGSWKTLIIRERYSYTQLAKTYFPKTISWLEKCNEDFLLVKFSALDPGTHILSHTGPSNERLRGHFTIVHSGGAMLRVGDEWRTWEEGKVFVFDSSWEHEVIHNGPDKRIILILDVWHPDYINSYSDGH